MTLSEKLGGLGCSWVSIYALLLFIAALLSPLSEANHEKEDWINGEKTEDLVAFLDRLYTAKRQVEQRIVILGGEDDTVRLQ
jgi:hypothetical protein